MQKPNVSSILYTQASEELQKKVEAELIVEDPKEKEEDSKSTERG